MADETQYWMVQKSTGKQVEKDNGEFDWEVETYPTDDLTTLFEEHRGLYRGDVAAWVEEVQKGEFLAQHLGLLIREATPEDMEKYASTFNRRKWADEWRNAEAVKQATQVDRKTKLVADYNENVRSSEDAGRFFAQTKLNTRDFLTWLQATHQTANSGIKLNDSALRAFEEYRTAKAPLKSKRLTGAEALKSIKATLGRKRATVKSKDAKSVEEG